MNVVGKNVAGKNVANVATLGESVQSLQLHYTLFPRGGVYYIHIIIYTLTHILKLYRNRDLKS